MLLAVDAPRDLASLVADVGKRPRDPELKPRLSETALGLLICLSMVFDLACCGWAGGTFCHIGDGVRAYSSDSPETKLRRLTSVFCGPSSSIDGG